MKETTMAIILRRRMIDDNRQGNKECRARDSRVYREERKLDGAKIAKWVLLS